MRLWTIVFTSFNLFIHLQVTYLRGGLVVKLNRGKIRGKTVTSATGKEVDAFLGVPFAQPPTGKLRFRPPLMPKPWEDILETTTLPNSCMQSLKDPLRKFPGSSRLLPATPVSEDCLKLNVWVPKDRLSNMEVMVFIHGGGFSFGSSSVPLYDGATLASEEDVIVITINYRLNSFGFLSLDDVNAPGNVGLLDQIMALRWVRENVVNFDGDPQKVTIFGHDAGAVSVGLHLLSPETSVLFGRTIIQSGGATAQWALQDREKNRFLGLKLAEKLCPNAKNVTDVLECLQKADAHDLINSEPMADAESSDASVFRPIIDHNFLSHEPNVMFDNQWFTPKNVLMGVTKEEGSIFLASLLPQVFNAHRHDAMPTHADVMTLVRTLFPNASDFVYKAVELFYTNWHDPDNPRSNTKAANSLVGDVTFVCSQNRMAHALVKSGSSVYMYFFVHRSSRNHFPKWMGANHGQELVYIFGEPLNGSFRYSKADVKLSRRIMKYWANFAKIGTPNSDFEPHIIWPRYGPIRKQYQVLAPDVSTIGSKLRDRVCFFWREVFPHITNVTVHW